MGEQKRRYMVRDGVARTSIVDDEAPDRLVVHTQQDLEPILDGIARDREIMPHGTNKLAARLPMVIVENLIERGIYGDEDRFPRLVKFERGNPLENLEGTSLMCGFGIGTIFQVAIFVVVVLVVLALLRILLGDWFAGITATPYWNVIQIVIGGVVAIVILIFLWRLAECAGVFGRVGLLEIWHV